MVELDKKIIMLRYPRQLHVVAFVLHLKSALPSDLHFPLELVFVPHSSHHWHIQALTAAKLETERARYIAQTPHPL